MAKVEKLPKKPTNHLYPTYRDTPTPKNVKGGFEVIEEDDSNSRAIGYDIFLLVFILFWSILHRHVFCG